MHEGEDVIIEGLHTEAFEFRVEGDNRVILPGEATDFRLAVGGHILPPYHAKLLPLLAISTLDLKFMGEDVGQFGAIAIPSSSDLLLLIVVVTACEEVSEDEFGHVDLLLLVDLNGDALAIVMDTHPSLLGVYLHLQQVHALVPLVVVSSVDQDLIEDLVESGDVSDLLQ